MKTYATNVIGIINGRFHAVDLQKSILVYDIGGMSCVFRRVLDRASLVEAGGKRGSIQPTAGADTCGTAAYSDEI